MTPTSPKARLPSTSATRLSVASFVATARLTARMVRPTPPFGLKTPMTFAFAAWAPLGPPRAAVPPRWVVALNWARVACSPW